MDSTNQDRFWCFPYCFALVMWMKLSGIDFDTFRNNVTLCLQSTCLCSKPSRRFTSLATLWPYLWYKMWNSSSLLMNLTFEVETNWSRIISTLIIRISYVISNLFKSSRWTFSILRYRPPYFVQCVLVLSLCTNHFTIADNTQIIHLPLFQV